MKGITRTVVGYSGGKENNPTYRSIKDSTESILLEYDPDIITFEDILDEVCPTTLQP
jgi:peptide-methionine (S)-S-oxide reductase